MKKVYLTVCVDAENKDISLATTTIAPAVYDSVLFEQTGNGWIEEPSAEDLELIKQSIDTLNTKL